MYYVTVFSRTVLETDDKEEFKRVSELIRHSSWNRWMAFGVR